MDENNKKGSPNSQAGSRPNGKTGPTVHTESEPHPTVAVKPFFLVCPACLCFDSDLEPGAKPGDVCTCCGEAKIERLQRRDFMRAIARKIVWELL